MLLFIIILALVKTTQCSDFDGLVLPVVVRSTFNLGFFLLYIVFNSIEQERLFLFCHNCIQNFDFDR